MCSGVDLKLKIVAFTKHYIFMNLAVLYSPLLPLYVSILCNTDYSCRNIIRYTQDCFYNPETWQEADQNVLIPQAQTSALESFKNVYDPVDGRSMSVWYEYLILYMSAPLNCVTIELSNYSARGCRLLRPTCEYTEGNVSIQLPLSKVVI